jgi:GTP-sensing pleiotropic transcriptional regulator CodY
MKRVEVRQFLNDGVNLLAPVCQFNAGQLSEFNKTFDKEFPYAWVYQLSAGVELNGSLPMDSWSIIIRIAKLDKMDSTELQYEPIVDDCDYIGQQLIKKYNRDLSDSKLITLTGISRTPFYKQHADVLTGVDLAFTLNIPDKTNLCV